MRWRRKRPSCLCDKQLRREHEYHSLFQFGRVENRNAIRRAESTASCRRKSFRVAKVYRTGQLRRFGFVCFRFVSDLFQMNGWSKTYIVWWICDEGNAMYRLIFRYICWCYHIIVWPWFLITFCLFIRFHEVAYFCMHVLVRFLVQQCLFHLQRLCFLSQRRQQNNTTCSSNVVVL